MRIEYPAIIDNGFKKYYFCYSLQQKIQDVHNNWGQKYKNGEITKEEWEEFLEVWFDPRHDLVLAEILRLRKRAKEKNWNIILNNVFIED